MAKLADTIDIIIEVERPKGLGFRFKAVIKLIQLAEWIGRVKLNVTVRTEK